MVICFCPGLVLGAYRSKFGSNLDIQAVQEDGDLSDDNSDIELDASEPIPFSDSDPEVEEENQEDELIDYGYDEQSDWEDENEPGENGNLGPEDGEEPINNDMDIFRQEGYGVL
jgi:hypothetical protein